MKRRKAFMLLPLLLMYALLYLATTKKLNCEGDCELLYRVDTMLTQNRSYIAWVTRCSQNRISDTVCVYVTDTTGIDWNLLADTTCRIATQVGLPRQKVFILRSSLSGPGTDTLARKECP